MGPGLLSDLLDLVLPAECAGCGASATPWCPRCAAGVGPPRRVRPLPGTPPTVAAGVYAGPLRRALLAYKEQGRRGLVDPLAGLLAGAAGAAAGIGMVGGPGPGPRPGPGIRPRSRPVSWARCWLVPVPSRPGAARARGGDHVRALTDALAERLAAGGGGGRGGVGVAGVWVVAAVRMRPGGRDSVGLDAAARTANLRGRLITRMEQLPPSGTAVLLVDDVVTTGATLRACSTALAAVGVPVNGALTLCDAAGAHRNSR